MAKKNKTESNSLKQVKEEAKKLGIRLTKDVNGKRVSKTEEELKNEIETTTQSNTEAEKVNSVETKQIPTPTKTKETIRKENLLVEQQKSGIQADVDNEITDRINSFRANALRKSWSKSALIYLAENLFNNVKVEELNNKQIRFIINGITIPKEGYFSVQ